MKEKEENQDITEDQVNRLLNQIFPLSTAIGPVEKNQAWDAIRQKALKKGRVVQMWQRVQKFAVASVAVICAGAFAYFMSNGGLLTDNIVCVLNETDSVLVHYLPDSSVVTLRVGSSIEYAPDFAGDRHVVLHGDAYFAVRKLNRKPFVVNTEHARVKVLGTEFYLKTLPDSAISLTVTEGRVAFSDSSCSNLAICSAGQSGLLPLGADKPDIANEIGENVLAWKTKEFRFHAESLQEICYSLSDYYSAKFVPDPSIAHLKLSGVYRNMTKEKICTIVSATLGVGCSYSADSTVINFVSNKK